MEDQSKKCEVCVANATIFEHHSDREVALCGEHAAMDGWVDVVTSMEAAESLMSNWCELAQEDFLDRGESAVPFMSAILGKDRPMIFDWAEAKKVVPNMDDARFKSSVYGFIRHKVVEMRALAYVQIGVARMLTLNRKGEIDPEELMNSSMDEVAESVHREPIDVIFCSCQNKHKVVSVSIPLFDVDGKRSLGEVTRVEFPNDAKTTLGMMKVF